MQSGSWTTSRRRPRSPISELFRAIVLEVLSGDRKGQYSIRVNGQWRIGFRWAGTDALEVEIVDYH